MLSKTSAPAPGFNGLGLCTQTDPDVFFPDRVNDATTRYAKEICLQCPFRSDCLQGALDRGEEYGVWGGLDEKERRRLRRARTA
ncbi:WhiB family transcriptional regulator [Streptomyces sp. NPDC057674]|uniref:WhiB family transcriptional regulator n=1 Tax=Streptomyces sp. NPDC057674 TaxID=3346203 RepID=UPI0036AAE06D